jgi:hypothetical protein
MTVLNALSLVESLATSKVSTFARNAQFLGCSSVTPTIVLALVSTQDFVNRLELTFNTPIQLDGPAPIPNQWLISAAPGVVIPTISSVVVSGNKIKLYHSEAKTGAAYILTIPFAGIRDLSNGLYLGPFSSAFTGVGVAPFVSLAASDDSLHVKVIFSEAVNATQALNISNYSIPGLSIFDVKKETDQVFELKTSPQTVGVVYTLTVNNINDLYGNPI